MPHRPNCTTPLDLTQTLRHAETPDKATAGRNFLRSRLRIFRGRAGQSGANKSLHRLCRTLGQKFRLAWLRNWLGKYLTPASRLVYRRPSCRTVIVAKLVASQTGCLLRDGPPVLSAAKALNSSPRFTPVVDLRIFTFILTSREDMSLIRFGFFCLGGWFFVWLFWFLVFRFGLPRFLWLVSSQLSSRIHLR